jgi:hypothetical protein
MTRKRRQHLKAKKAITPAQRTFFEHLNGSKAHPALGAVTNAPQSQDGPHAVDCSVKREELSPISSQASRRGRLPQRDRYRPHMSRRRGGDYWPPLNTFGIGSDFYRPSRRRSRSPVRSNEIYRMRTPSRESRPNGPRQEDHHLHSEGYRGQAIVHDRYQMRTASRERDMTRSKRCDDELNRRNCRYRSPSPRRGLDTHHRWSEDLRVTMIVHIPERAGSVKSSRSQPAVSNFGAGHNVSPGTEPNVPDAGSRCVMQ